MLCGQRLTANPLRMRWLPPTCSPPAPQLSRGGRGVIRVMREPCRTRPEFKGSGPASPHPPTPPAPAGSAVCVDLTHCGTAGSSKPPCAITICTWASPLLGFVCFILSSHGGTGRSRAPAPRTPSAAQTARTRLPLAALELLQLVSYPFTTPRTSYEIGRRAITLQRSD